MSRLEAWCLVALLCWGAAVGCEPRRGVHRARDLWVVEGDADFRRSLRMEPGDFLSYETCACVPYRTPFWEVVGPRERRIPG